jgi:MoxR-like ATPase
VSVEGIGSVEDVTAGLDAAGYLADEGLATCVYLALRMQRPLLLEGDAGVGKTAVAHALAAWLGGPLIRLQCYEGIEASQALYEWDHARQLLHLRAAEVAGTARGADVGDLEADLHHERFLNRRPLLQSFGSVGEAPRVLLIDEVDRADGEFEAMLLELLSEWTVTIPELGTIRAEVPPVAVLTSNRTRDVHDALKRRCLYHWVDHPDLDREIAVVSRHVPALSATLVRQVAAAVAAIRALQPYKPPGVSETIDWAKALGELGVVELDEPMVSATLGTVVKYREDEERIRSAGLGSLLTGAVSGPSGDA